MPSACTTMKPLAVLPRADHEYRPWARTRRADHIMLDDRVLLRGIEVEGRIRIPQMLVFPSAAFQAKRSGGFQPVANRATGVGLLQHAHQTAVVAAGAAR